MRGNDVVLKPVFQVILRNNWGEFEGKVNIAPIESGNLQVHWYKGNVLLDKSKRSLEGVLDYNAVVHLKKTKLNITDWRQVC
ncbi:hypothetical protein H6G06_06230 [Anabaena sphaerica FACHB-251]|uniref:Uncharacterized protein n=1 Tax=Anabaena sphaerica FACHB-251 TaxID=2692883 RepID=A0A926ZYU8_9NOST|nr:hypothetical protein [Anabaena sphaerica FACHB-251]